MSERPLVVTVVASCLLLGSALVLGALWSGSSGGQAFAEAATSAYDSSWLPWAAAIVTALCAGGLMLGWSVARWVLLFWMAYGVFEGLFLLDERSYSVAAILAYAAIAAALFLPASNEWLNRHRA